MDETTMHSHLKGDFLAYNHVSSSVGGWPCHVNRCVTSNERCRTYLSQGVAVCFMGDRVDRSPRQAPEESPSLNHSCPLCGTPIVEGQYPRHQICLEDEADGARNRIIAQRLCPDCWHDLYAGTV